MSIHFNIIVHACTCMMFISNHIYRKVHVPKFEYIEDINVLEFISTGDRIFYIFMSAK